MIGIGALSIWHVTLIIEEYDMIWLTAIQHFDKDMACERLSPKPIEVLHIKNSHWKIKILVA